MNSEAADWHRDLKRPANTAELLSPCGDSAALAAALEFGADAVYLGAKSLGMRTAPQNFSWDELEQACALVHSRGKKLYLTCNILPRNADIPSYPAFLANAEAAGVDALILSDLGLLEAAKRHAPHTEIHISTQAGVTNYESALALYRLGARRFVPARELHLEELAQMKAKLPQDAQLECFVHGAMCVCFSGRCLISSYLTGRSANAGDCTQPCRWNYSLVEETRPGQYFPLFEEDGGSYLLNAQDLCMISHLPELLAAGIDSLKIEGRAKSEYYTAVVTNSYRCALDGLAACENPAQYQPEPWIRAELDKISHRPYCTGFFFADAAMIHEGGGYERAWELAAIAESWEDGVLTVRQRNRFFEGEMLEVFLPGQKPAQITVRGLCDLDGSPLTNAPNPMRLFRFCCETPIPSGAILRREKDAPCRL